LTVVVVGDGTLQVGVDCRKFQQFPKVFGRALAVHGPKFAPSRERPPDASRG
jgi:hypothetical protein